MKIYDVLILEAGASGLMCASHLDKKLSTAIVDINAKVAKKLKIFSRLTNKLNSDTYNEMVAII